MSKKKNQQSKKNKGRQVVPGITISSKNEATVAPELSDVLFDLALKLESSTGLAVDVQHVLAAIVMASQTGELNSQQSLSDGPDKLLPLLEKYTRIVFANFGGKVGQDD